MEEKKEESQAETLYDKTAKIVEAQKLENDRREAIILKEQELQATKMLGGETEAGETPKPEPEIDPKEYAEKAMRGEIELKK